MIRLDDTTKLCHIAKAVFNRYSFANSHREYVHKIQLSNESTEYECRVFTKLPPVNSYIKMGHISENTIEEHIDLTDIHEAIGNMDWSTVTLYSNDVGSVDCDVQY